MSDQDEKKLDRILGEQVEYYRARSSEYDEWFFRRGRYDRGEDQKRRWFDEVARVEEALRDAGPRGDVLELAAGTGLWTRHLAKTARSVHAVDASREALEINDERAGADNVQYDLADLFTWRPARTYDFVFFGFWLSHVPPQGFDAFWDMVGRALAPGGRVFFVDSRFTPESTARDHEIDRSGTVTRRLADGREFRIVKVFYEPDDLQRRLERIGWSAAVRETETFFLHGLVTRKDEPGESE